MEISDNFIMFGLAILYACACPLACFFVMIYNLFDIKFDLKTKYIAVRRPLANVRANIGPWLFLAEFMAIAAVISNCMLLYFSSQSLSGWFNQQFHILSEVNMLWILVALEHFIILIKIWSAIAI